MFELLTIKNSKTDLVTKARAHALREQDEEVAVQQFLQTIHTDRNLIRELKEVGRKTVQHLCREAGIRNELRRATIYEEMENRWDQTLARTVREYLRDHGPESAAGDKPVSGITIEFVSS